MYTGEKSSFYKTLAELRELFIANSFAKQIGMAHPELWLEAEYDADQPTRQRPNLDWRETAEKIGELGLIKVIEEYADPIDRRSQFWKKVVPDQIKEKIAPFVGHKMIKVYLALPSEVVNDFSDVTVIILYSLRNKKFLHTTSFLPNGEHIIPFATKTDVFKILLATWENHGPKWKTARQVLCNFFAQQIRTIRHTAEQTFDSAVAVRLDGSDPLPADWVVVFDDNGQELTIYPGKSFQANKIVRAPDTKKVRIPTVSSIRPMEILLMACGFFLIRGGIWAETQQGLFKGQSHHSDGDALRVFITHQRFCPDPIPGSGTTCSFQRTKMEA